MAVTDRTHQALVRLLGTRLADALMVETAPSFLVAADGRTVLYANAQGKAALGLADDGVDGPTRLADGAPGTARLAAICDDNSTAGPRLERLRFFSGMRGIALTALCRRLVLLNGEAAVLASAIPQTRSMGSETPLVAQDHLQAMIEPVKVADPELIATRTMPAAGQPETTTAKPLSPILSVNRGSNSGRFVFALDDAGRLARLSPHFEAEVGAENTPETGENLAAFIARFDVRAAEQLATGVASGETWEGISLNWPLGDGRSLVPAELSALPILDEQSRIVGYSGFGKLRMQSRFDAPMMTSPEAGNITDDIAMRDDLFSSLEPADADDSVDIPDEISDADGNEAVDNDAVANDTAQKPDNKSLPRLDTPALPDEAPSTSKIVSIKTGQATTGFPGFQRHGLSSTERNAFREIAKALGAKMEGQDDTDLAPLDSTENISPLQEAPIEDRHHALTAQDNTASGEAPIIGNDNDLLDRLPIGLLVLAGDQPLFVNRTLLDLTGYPDQMAFAARDGARAIFRKSSRPNADADGINTMVLSTVDGEMVPVDSLLQRVNWQGRNATLISFRRAVELEQGKALRSVALDLKRARTEGEELRAILNTATDGVITLDGAGSILSMNGSAEALFGVYANEAVGEPLISLLHRDSHADALDYLDGLKRNGVRSVLNDGRDVFGREKKGGRIPLFMTLGRISEEDPPRYCAVLRDLTAWKRAEADLTEARRAAEAASAKKSDFLAKISHEIRTPMNAIIGFSEVMQEERLGPLGNPKYREYLGDIQTSGRHVVSLVNDLLDLAKIEAGRMELDFAATDLNAVVTSAVSIIQPQANANRILIRSQLTPSLPPVVADERAMRQILLNMLSNATRFTESGGQVIVATTLLDTGEAVIRIRDTGIGMTTSEIEQAMEPFRQVGTRRNTGGTGLGLPLTKALVEANRAAFAIRSTPGEGTLVEVTFPATRVLAE